MDNFLNFKIQKCDACKNGVKFFHKPVGDDVKKPPVLFFLSLPLYSPVNEAIILQYTV